MSDEPNTPVEGEEIPATDAPVGDDAADDANTPAANDDAPAEDTDETPAE